MKDKVLKCSDCICLTCIADCDRTLCREGLVDVESRERQQVIRICHAIECREYIGEKVGGRT